jgi:large subunit ribosomal protein L25
MARKELTVQPRQVLGKKVAQLRRTGVLPANIYGHGIDSVSVQIETEALELTLKAAVANEVIDLTVEGERAARPVVIHSIQRHPLGRGILHANFYQVSLREKMRAAVPIVLTGRSEAVETYNGVLLAGIEALQVEALPLDMPAHFEVDISSLTELDTSIHVREIEVPANVTVLTEEDVVVATVSSPRVSAEELEEMGAPAAAAAEEEPEGESGSEEKDEDEKEGAEN